MPKKKSQKQQRDLAYVAGLIDGEGSFTAGRPTRTQVSPKMCMSLTNLELLQWCQGEFGGTIHEHSAARKWNNKKKAWVWLLIGQDMCDFIEDVAPYLKLKKRQAWLCWQIQTVRCWAAANRPGAHGWAPKNPDILKFYDGCWRTLRKLNARGVYHAWAQEENGERGTLPAEQGQPTDGRPEGEVEGRAA